MRAGRMSDWWGRVGGGGGCGMARSLAKTSEILYISTNE